MFDNHTHNDDVKSHGNTSLKMKKKIEKIKNFNI